MKPSYVPLLKALKSEFDAIAEMGNKEAEKILPLFDITRMGQNILEAKRFEGCSAIKAAYIEEVVSGIARVWNGRPAMIDAYHWAADASVESGEHIIPYAYSRLESLGVEVIPVIGYDRWENEQYRLAIQTIDRTTHHFCLRLDTIAIEDSAEPDFFQENITDILENLELEPKDLLALIDFGDLASINQEALASRTVSIINQLRDMGFKTFVTAGCSLPKTIDKAVKKPDSQGVVIRKEMLLWQSLRDSIPLINLIYGDYCIRGPNTNEGIRSKHTNGKIRYTIDRKTFVVRGHSMSLPGKGEQMYTLAQILIDSPHYLGERFSWGDWRVKECSKRKFKGSAAQWITIDSSHHLSYVVLEIQEFEIAKAATERSTASSDAASTGQAT